MTQNDLGIALGDLASRSEGAQAAQYLQQAVEAYRSALQVSPESSCPRTGQRPRTTWVLRSAIWRVAARARRPPHICSRRSRPTAAPCT